MCLRVFFPSCDNLQLLQKRLLPGFLGRKKERLEWLRFFVKLETIMEPQLQNSKTSSVTGERSIGNPRGKGFTL